jgi:hypothetical protein
MGKREKAAVASSAAISVKTLPSSTAMPPTLFQGVDKSGAAFKLLSSMGWKEGEGLVREAECRGARGGAVSRVRGAANPRPPGVQAPCRTPPDARPTAACGHARTHERLSPPCMAPCVQPPSPSHHPASPYQRLQGAKKQGISEHIRVKKKFDSTGVGAVRVLVAVFVLYQGTLWIARYAPGKPSVTG